MTREQLEATLTLHGFVPVRSSSGNKGIYSPTEDKGYAVEVNQMGGHWETRTMGRTNDTPYDHELQWQMLPKEALEALIARIDFERDKIKAALDFVSVGTRL